MKRIIATALAAVMILSLLATLAVVPVGASDVGEGDWNVFARAGEYAQDTEGNIDYTSLPSDILPGYYYDEEGLHVSGDYKNGMGQRFNIMTKEEVNIKDGVTMKVRVDQFAYGGDMWFSFVIHDKPMVSQAGDPATFGQGYVSLIRTQKSKQGVKFSAMESFVQSTSYYDTHRDPANPDATGIWMEGGSNQGGNASNPVSMGMFGWGNGTDPRGNIAEVGPKFADDGSVELTFKLVYDQITGEYKLNICGVDVNSVILTDFLDWDFSDGMAYIGFSAHSTVSDATAAVTVTEFGDATSTSVPAGSDSREEYDGTEPIAPIPDDDGIEEGQPALLFDAKNEKEEYRYTGRFSSVQHFSYSANKDGTFTLSTTKNESPYVTLFPKKSVSYEASNYPYVAILLRNYCNCVLGEGETMADCQLSGETVDMYYIAGDNNGANDDIITNSGPSIFYELGDDGNYYRLLVVDLSEKEAWAGRINGVQIVFNGMQLANQSQNKFGLCYVGYFATLEEASEYSLSYVESMQACEHPNLQTVEGVEATCTQAGKTEGKQCLDCGKWEISQEQIPVKGHSLVVAPRVEPTCQAQGFGLGEKCENCDYTHQEVLPKLDHEFIDGAYAYDDDNHWIPCRYADAGCTMTKEAPAAHTEGEVCAVCGRGCNHENFTEVISKEPSCWEFGIKYNHCNDCDTNFGHSNINKTDHTPITVTGTEATCTSTGKTDGEECEICGDVVTAQTTIPMKEHTSVTIEAVAPTCTEPGSSEYTKCTVCERNLTNPTTIPATSHVWADDKDTECDVCGETRTIADDNTEAPVKPNTNNNSNSGNKGDDKKEEGGCGSVIGFGAIAVCASIVLAGAMCFKKKN